ncbi:formin 2 [Plasmodium gonderi]|uniref:Formin 2 n=1 Tax=Plasmodium gonderi TaxID=77519 RepID=A0A1Y1JM77_PLAGO|nr:formin 2 [Plasmodium gonderi]GAW83571.1 formin 2 [Plasmodium gonderi]
MRNQLERNEKGTTKKREQRYKKNEKGKKDEERRYGKNLNYYPCSSEIESRRIDSMNRKKRITKERLWNNENFHEDDENMMCLQNFILNDISDDNINETNKIVYDNFENEKGKKFPYGSEKRRENKKLNKNHNKNIAQEKNRLRDMTYNQITGLNLTNYLLVPDEMRHKYTNTYLFQISKRLLVMKKPWRLPKNVELQINNVYHLSNYIKVLERISSEYLNDPPINYYYKGLELYNKNVFANIDYLLKKVDIKNIPKFFHYKDLIKVNECYYDLSTFGKSPNAMFYQSYVIWDIHGSSLTLEQEYENFFDSQIMDYSFGEKEFPNLKYILSICSSILFWLNFNKKDNFAIINYHKISSFILLIFSCVMLVIDNTLTFSQIQEILYKSSKINNSYKDNEEDNTNADITSNYFGNKYENNSNCEKSDDTSYMQANKEMEKKYSYILKGNNEIYPNNNTRRRNRHSYEKEKYISQRKNIHKNNAHEGEVHTKKREISDSTHVHNFNNYNINDYAPYDILFNRSDMALPNSEYSRYKGINEFNKMQYHTLNLSRRSGEFDNEIKNSLNKKKPKFSNSWGFHLTNRETYKNNKVKDHHFWIPFDYWKSSHKRYFFYIYELMKNKNKKVENIPFKLKSIIFSDYAMCSLSVEVYEIIYKDNQEFHLDVLSDYDSHEEEVSTDEGLNKFTDPEESNGRKYAQNASGEESTCEDEIFQSDFSLHGKSKHYELKMKQRSLNECNPSQYLDRKHETEYFINKLYNTGSAKKANSKICTENNPLCRKIHMNNDPYGEGESFENLSLSKNAPAKDIFFIDRTQDKKIEVKNKLRRTSNYNLRNSSNTGSGSCKVETFYMENSLNPLNSSNSSNEANTSNSPSAENTSNLPSAENTSNSPIEENYRNPSKSPNFVLNHNVEPEEGEEKNVDHNPPSIPSENIYNRQNRNQHGDKYILSRQLRSKSPKKISTDHMYRYKNEEISFKSNIQNGITKGKISTTKKTKSQTSFGEKKNNNSVNESEYYISIMKERFRDIPKRGGRKGGDEEEYMKDKKRKEKKIYDFLRKKRKKNSSKMEDGNKGGTCTKSGYEYFLKCNSLNYNIVSSYEKNKKKYVTIDFTHDAEGNTKEHIICGDILILIGHKNIEKFHKGFSSSYSFHTGFLKKSSSEIIHIRKDDMDINSNYESYIPDGMKLSIILDTASNNDCMKAYKKSLKSHNKTEDLKSLKVFEKSKSFESNDSKHVISYDHRGYENSISESEMSFHIKGMKKSTGKVIRRRKEREKESQDSEGNEEGKDEWRNRKGKHRLVTNMRREIKARECSEECEEKCEDDREEEFEDDRKEEFEEECEDFEEKNEESDEIRNHKGETKPRRKQEREEMGYKLSEERDQKNNLHISNNKKINFDSKINDNSHSIFNDKEPKIKYNASNITQLLTSLFGFKNKEDKYSLVKKQNACSLLSSKRSFSNLISLKDYLQRQYEVITRPTESMYNFVKNHVLKVNMPLVHYLKKITHLSNLKIYYSLKLCNNDLSKSLNFIVSIWGIKILKNKSSIRYSSNFNELPEFREEFKQIPPRDASIKTFIESTKNVDYLDSTSVSCTHVEYYEKMDDSANLNKENEQIVSNEETDVEYSKEKTKKINFPQFLRETIELNESGKSIVLDCLVPYNASNSMDKAKNEVKNEGTNKDGSNHLSKYLNEHNPKEQAMNRINNKGQSEVVTNIDGIKIAKLEINKSYYEMRGEEVGFKKGIEEKDLTKIEKEKVDYYKENIIEDNESFLKSMVAKEEPSKPVDYISKNDDILKKIEENHFFYAKLPSGELIKLKIKETDDSGTYDSIPLLFIESMDDSERLVRSLSSLNLNEEAQKNEGITLDNVVHKDSLINNLEKMYDHMITKKNSVDSTLSAESEKTAASRYSTCVIEPSLNSIVQVREKVVHENVVHQKRNVEKIVKEGELVLRENTKGIMEENVEMKKVVKSETQEGKRNDAVYQKADVKMGNKISDEMMKQSASEIRTVEKTGVNALLKKTKEKRPPPPLPAVFQKSLIPKVKSDTMEKEEHTKKECNTKIIVPKKVGKKIPGPPPPLPPFMLNKNKMGEKSKMGMKKCPMNLGLKKCGKIQEKRPLGIKLHWQLLPTHKIEGTVFNEIKSQETKYNIIDTKAVHKLFARVKVEKTIIKKSTESKKKSNEEKLITVLDRTRAQNIGILLRFPISTQEIVNKINIFDLENINAEFLQKLLHILPTKEESDGILQKLEHENVKEENFRDVERKLIPFVYLNKCQCKIEICLFSLKYDKMINEINKDLDTYNKAVKEVRSSVRLRSLLKAVLKWGNYVNYGVNDNEDLVALGFTLSSVLKLTEFKSSLDNAITSLHYITVSLCTYLPNLNMNCLESDLSSVLIASKMSSETVDILLASLDKEITYVKTQLKCTYEDIFKEKMKNILQDSETKYINSQKRYEETKKCVHELGTYLGEDMTKSGNLENIFIILSSVVENFTKCYKDILANPKKFSIMLNDENLLDVYYTIFGKRKNKSTFISKNDSVMNKEISANKQILSNEKNENIKISRLKSCISTVRKNDNTKSSMFQLRNKLMQDIQNRHFIKRGISDINKIENEHIILQNDKNDTHDLSTECDRNDEKKGIGKGVKSIPNNVNAEGANVSFNQCFGEKIKVEDKMNGGIINEMSLGKELNVDMRSLDVLTTEMKIGEELKIQGKIRANINIVDIKKDNLDTRITEEKMTE